MTLRRLVAPNAQESVQRRSSPCDDWNCREGRISGHERNQQRDVEDARYSGRIRSLNRTCWRRRIQRAAAVCFRLRRGRMMLFRRGLSRLMAAGSWLRRFGRNITHSAAKSWRQRQNHGGKENNEFGRSSIHPGIIRMSGRVGSTDFSPDRRKWIAGRALQRPSSSIFGWHRSPLLIILPNK